MAALTEKVIQYDVEQGMKDYLDPMFIYVIMKEKLSGKECENHVSRAIEAVEERKERKRVDAGDAG